MDRTRLLQIKHNLAKQIGEVDRVMQEIAVNGTASATLSAGGGSKSYTRIDLTTLSKFRDRLADRYASVLQALRGMIPGSPRHISIVRC